jgi:hypothetical protein
MADRFPRRIPTKGGVEGVFLRKDVSADGFWDSSELACS